MANSSHTPEQIAEQLKRRWGRSRNLHDEPIAIIGPDFQSKNAQLRINSQLWPWHLADFNLATSYDSGSQSMLSLWDAMLRFWRPTDADVRQPRIEDEKSGLFIHGLEYLDDDDLRKAMLWLKRNHSNIGRRSVIWLPESIAETPADRKLANAIVEAIPQLERSAREVEGLLYKAKMEGPMHINPSTDWSDAEYAIRRWPHLAPPRDASLTWRQLANRIRDTGDPGSSAVADSLWDIPGTISDFPLTAEVVPRSINRNPSKSLAVQRKMSKKEFEKWFRADVMPHVARAESMGLDVAPHSRISAWNYAVEDLIEAGDIPRTASRWVHPKWLYKEIAKPSFIRQATGGHPGPFGGPGWSPRR